MDADTSPDTVVARARRRSKGLSAERSIRRNPRSIKAEGREPVGGDASQGRASDREKGGCHRPGRSSTHRDAVLQPRVAAARVGQASITPAGPAEAASGTRPPATGLAEATCAGAGASHLTAPLAPAVLQPLFRWPRFAHRRQTDERDCGGDSRRCRAATMIATGADSRDDNRSQSAPDHRLSDRQKSAR